MIQTSKTMVFISVVIFFFVLDMSVSGTNFSPEKANFAIKFKEEISQYKVIGIFVLPEEILTLEAWDQWAGEEYTIEVNAGEIIGFEGNKWQWRAPKDVGLYNIKIFHSKEFDSMTLNIFVMVPFEEYKGEYLNGYRIGKYPSIPLKKLSIYKPPRGFIEATKENEETFVSPHFKLKQFLSKQLSDYPKYVVLKERLLLKLELILEEVNERGYRCETFHVMSGYRTPYYNRVIGNVRYSRHLWGGAADIFIDENPKDDMMDDLNKDGKIDYQDAAIIFDIIDAVYRKPFYEIFIGGLGKYRKSRSHGPFVHVDVRGFRARW
jgi:uncharacterized protein YcbK (DUF882 family)